MMYLIAVLCPPLAVLLCGKPFQAVLNLILCLFLYVPGAVHALLVASDHYADRRNERLLQAMAYRYS
jgi:uncharacterized membrane protein YqaE (UPF0057 family)